MRKTTKRFFFVYKLSIIGLNATPTLKILNAHPASKMLSIP